MLIFQSEMFNFKFDFRIMLPSPAHFQRKPESRWAGPRGRRVARRRDLDDVLAARARPRREGRDPVRVAGGDGLEAHLEAGSCTTTRSGFTNFAGLVLGCIEAKFCKQICV